MGRRWHRFVSELSKFAATGVVATVVAVSLFNWLVHVSPGPAEPLLSGRPTTAYVLANIVGMLISYHMSRRWAFRHREPVGVASGRLTYFGINTASLLIPASLLWVSRNVLGWESALADNLVANGLGLALAFLTRFYLFRMFVFVHPDRAEPGSGRPAVQRTVRE